MQIFSEFNSCELHINFPFHCLYRLLNFLTSLAISNTIKIDLNPKKRSKRTHNSRSYWLRQCENRTVSISIPTTNAPKEMKNEWMEISQMVNGSEKRMIWMHFDFMTCSCFDGVFLYAEWVSKWVSLHIAQSSHFSKESKSEHFFCICQKINPNMYPTIMFRC